MLAAQGKPSALKAIRDQVQQHGEALGFPAEQIIELQKRVDAFATHEGTRAFVQVKSYLYGLRQDFDKANPLPSQVEAKAKDLDQRIDANAVLDATQKEVLHKENRDWAQGRDTIDYGLINDDRKRSENPDPMLASDIQTHYVAGLYGRGDFALKTRDSLLKVIRTGIRAKNWEATGHSRANFAAQAGKDEVGARSTHNYNTALEELLNANPGWTSDQAYAASESLFVVHRDMSDEANAAMLKHRLATPPVPVRVDTQAEVEALPSKTRYHWQNETQIRERP
jgi:hypothetical protein